MSVSITVIFDNYSLVNNSTPSWGFSCVLNNHGHMLLFDTGNDGKILLNNMQKMGFSPQDFDDIFISHLHWDHVGGLIEILRQKPHARVYIVKSALPDDVMYLSRLTDNIQLVDGPVRILPGIFSLGDMPGYMNEQAMAAETSAGLLLITGCAHPGIVHIAETAAKIFPEKEIELVMGGFHLKGLDKPAIHDINSKLKKLGVLKIAPSHCTGDLAIAEMRQYWNENYISSGIGLNLFFP